MKFLILTALFVQNILAQSTCNPPAIRRPPVIDQDGIGTCASASAAILMQMNIQDEDGSQGLRRTPSYLQMSIYSAARSTEPGFFKNEPGGARTFFNGYQHVCSVVDTAMNQGFCDSDNFPLDFVGEEDAMGSQQKSLDMIGQYLQGHLPDLERFRESLRTNPQGTKDLLAYLYQKHSDFCRQDPRELIVRNAWLRRKAAWQAQLSRTSDPAQRRVLTTLLQRTFGADGQPTAAAMQYGRDDLFERGMGAVTTPDRIATIGEGMMSVHWALHLDLNMQGFLATGVTDAGIQEDYRRTQYCQWPMLMAVQEYFQNPDCPVPGGTSAGEDVRNNVEALTRVVSRQDLRASVVGLMAPRCADQAARRRVTGLTCRETVVTPSNVAAKKEEVFSDLCAGRAVSFSVCRPFMRLTGPFSSANCSQPFPGSPNMDYHALTGIGMRNVDGRRQVFIQNSTGSRCDFADGNVLRSGFAGKVECELNSAGIPTGRFWIDEDLLMNNTQAISTLRRN